MITMPTGEDIHCVCIVWCVCWASWSWCLPPVSSFSDFFKMKNNNNKKKTNQIAIDIYSLSMKKMLIFSFLVFIQTKSRIKYRLLYYLKSKRKKEKNYGRFYANINALVVDSVFFFRFEEDSAKVIISFRCKVHENK